MSVRTRMKRQLPRNTPGAGPSIRSTTRFVAVAATIAVVAVAIGAGLLLVDGDPVPAPAVASGTDEVADRVPAGEAEPVRAAHAKLEFAFTGQAGAAGCEYTGPAIVTSGTVMSSFVNHSDVEARINIDKLAAGKTYDDFLARIGAGNGEYPVTSPAADRDAAKHAWLHSGWRTVHTAAAGATHRLPDGLALIPGDFVIYCWIEVEPLGPAELWPAGTLTVVP